jgi:hypothetical protein
LSRCRVAIAPVHHGATMQGWVVRTTIDLPDDLHKQALAIARDTQRTLSETVADLIRRGLRAGNTAAVFRDPKTGLPRVKRRNGRDFRGRSLEDQE